MLWLFGPSGVGKTTVGREICTRLGGAGVSCALVDTDMIGPMGFCCDISRTFHTGPGKASAEQRRMYALAVEQIQRQLIVWGYNGVAVDGIFAVVYFVLDI